MTSFIVEGGVSLNGEITPAGNKNEALPVLAASLLPGSPVVLRNIPYIGDINSMIQRLQGMGAVVESTVFGLRTGLDDMKAAGIESSEIRVIGGGSKSTQWLQIVADVFNARVTVPSQQEAAAFGAALQSLWCFQLADGDDITMEQVAAEHVRFDAERHVEP